MSFSAASLRAILEAQTPPAATGLVVAISGGADSACLATAIAHSPAPIRNLRLRAVHVDHGLQPAASDFRLACANLCAQLGIPLTILDVTVDLAGGESVEAAARDARYRALAGELQPGECLLTAHHAQDQAETVLLQLLRGSGLKGLAAMPLRRSLGPGWHLRPLLEVAKQELLQFAAAEGIEWRADPMNQDERFDRVYLRNQVWPQVASRWPGAAGALSRTARHVADAQTLLDASAASTVQKLRDGDALSLSGLRALPAAQQLNALRFWIIGHGAPMPPARRLIEGLRQFIEAQPDHQPVMRWGGHALRRYRQRLFLTATHLDGLGGPRTWPVAGRATLELGETLGVLGWSARRGGLDAARLPAVLSVRQRVGGETLKPRENAKTQSVQHLCQSLGVLPWLRDSLPLIYAGDSLVAVADLWQDARWCVSPGSAGLGIEWRRGPILV